MPALLTDVDVNVHVNSNSNVNLEALSGICGSVSLACWVVVFSPQILENFRRRSADGLSVAFLVIWLVGDVFNILGAVLQGVLPTMVILAAYYTLADVVLLCQVWWYRSLTLKDVDVDVDMDKSEGESAVTAVSTNVKCTGGVEGDVERQRLLATPHGAATGNLQSHERRGSFSSIRRHFTDVDGAHLSPATPLLKQPQTASSSPATTKSIKSQTRLQASLFNSIAVLLVCAAGVFGWWISANPHKHHKHYDDDLRGELPEFDTLGQVFGYLCAALYLGSRVPQLLLNYRRKSTEGISLLFFLFACIGNLTYDMSIFAFNPAPRCERGPRHCASGEQSMIYGRYIAVNASWIIGSLGTLVLDLGIFVQFFLYGKDEEEERRSGGDESGPAVD